MKRLLLFMLMLLVCSPIHANDLPSNYPSDVNYLVADGKIYTQGGGKARLGYFANSIEEAERMATFYEESIRSSQFVQDFACGDYLADAEIVHIYYEDSLYGICVYISKPMDGYLISADFCMECERVLIDAGFSTYAFYQDDFGIFYADAEYPVEPAPVPPAGMADGCITYYEGAWRYTSELEGPTGDILFQGMAMYAETEEMAETCAVNFASFLASYDWPWYGKPDVLPWDKPFVQKCYVIRNGEVTQVFWRIFFYDLSDPTNSNYAAWDQCLQDYCLGHGGSGGQNGIIIYGPSATASASNSGSVELNGSTLAQSDSGMSSVKLASGGRDVTVAQYTVQKVDAESDTVGTSEVTSEASISEGAEGSINVTNNTTINTNLELGDAPAPDSFTTEERQVSSSSDLLTETEPEYSYIVKGGSEDYSLDWEKFWSDVEDRLNEIFHFEDIKIFFETGVSSSDMITDWTITVFGYSFVVPWSQVAQLEVVQFARTAMSYLCILGTCLASFKLMV